MPPVYPVQNIERPIGPELIVIYVLQGLLGFFFKHITILDICVTEHTYD